jgi:peptide/nickel transport system permease protein
VRRGRRAGAGLALPAVTLGMPTAALFARVVRSSMAEVLTSDDLLFAEAKGISRMRVPLWHALKNALIPVATSRRSRPGRCSAAT